ncbi:DUF6492 family protein [Sedimentitalea sp. HM32M-2]|uniref:DUF6492 family protein n=1 Tax=Sedimentitalea sp. HM32M-2 TaxID=3351566 RepID=UPI00362E4AF7
MTDQNDASPKATIENGGLGLLTCSMATDLPLFELLARSVDDHVDPRIMHHVVVPAADLPRFRAFANDRREIVAQEDVLPERLRKLPAWLRHFSFLQAGLRRPIYLRPDRSVVRGWMLQQFLKIEMSRRIEAAAVMHVDSDVAFFRRLAPEDAFAGDRVRFFRVEGKPINPMHDAWVAGSCRFLGISPPARHDVHYIENCVLWSRAVARAMVDRMQEAQGKPLQDILFSAETMSEYYVYGIFADLCPEAAELAAEEVSFCNSYWPSEETGAVDFDALRSHLVPKHCAIAVQSTHDFTLADRARLYETASRTMATA